MNSTPSNLGGGKSLSASAPSYNFAPSQPVSIPSPSFENRRSGVPSSAAPASAPRKGQASRRQHRDKRRPARDSQMDDDDAMAEMRAVRNASSRRGQTSITHLLNFSAPSRPYHDHGYGHGRNTRRHATWGPGSGYHPVDKAKFVHANYRFVVSPSGDYTAQASDANKHVDWSDVDQVLASTESQATSCPICLSEPVAPRMARCGHIFCLPCLIRFMNSANADEPSARKEARRKMCPICEDSFKLAEVRPVRFYAGQENPLPRPGEDVVLRLMSRESGSTLALPREGGQDPVNQGEDVPWHFAANVMDYAHIMKGTHDYLAAEYDREMEDLRRQANEDEHQFGVEDGDWTIKAIRAITTAKDKIKEEPKPAEAEISSSLGSSLPKSAAKQPGGPAFFFYSAPPHLYLSPLDIRILKTKFGHVVDDAMKKRAKYLGHLPSGCVVSFLECDWTDIVPADILERFAGELERRRQSHRDKDAQEERERVQAERLEAAAIGRTARRHFDQAHGDSVDANPVVNIDDFQPLAPAPGSTSPDAQAESSRPADASTSSSTSTTVWGTRAIPISPSLEPIAERDGHDGWLRDEEFLGPAEIALQMEAFGLEGSSPGPSSGGGGQGGGKKKKKQKITLMSTGSRRFG